MARPRVFVSSTFYDLQHIRASFEILLTSLGYDAVLFEKGGIAYWPDTPLDDSCYREAGQADIFVLIVGGRYGAKANEGVIPKVGPQPQLEEYISITRQEYRTAADRQIPIYILIQSAVLSEYRTYQANKGNTGIQYAHVDSVGIFSMIDEILSEHRNNPIFGFNTFREIETWLKEQWAGLFRELLNRRRDGKALEPLEMQIANLASMNETLKSYLETMMRKEDDAESIRLIESEKRRLERSKSANELRSNDLIAFIASANSLPKATIANSFIEARTLREFVDQVEKLAARKSNRNEPDWAKTFLGLVQNNQAASEDLKAAIDTAFKDAEEFLQDIRLAS